MERLNKIELIFNSILIVLISILTYFLLSSASPLSTEPYHRSSESECLYRTERFLSAYNSQSKKVFDSVSQFVETALFDELRMNIFESESSCPQLDITDVTFYEDKTQVEPYRVLYSFNLTSNGSTNGFQMLFTLDKKFTITHAEGSVSY